MIGLEELDIDLDINGGLLYDVVSLLLVGTGQGCVYQGVSDAALWSARTIPKSTGSE